VPSEEEEEEEEEEEKKKMKKYSVLKPIIRVNLNI